MKNLRKQNGITLVALVVTIVILLILSGVTLSMVLGENGLITKAREARINYLNASLEEQEVLNSLEKELKSYVTTDVWDGLSKEKPKIDANRDWHIYTCAELKYFEEYVNGTLLPAEKEGIEEITADTIVYLEANLNLGAKIEGDTLVEGTKWIPIGKDKDNSFIGTFEGNKHYITGMYVSKDDKFTGLFGVSDNTIQNITIKDSYVEGKNNAIAAVVGLGYIVENCHNINTTCVQKGSAINVAGIVGQINKKISNCTNTGTIISRGKSSAGSAQCGGVVGICKSDTNVIVSDCINNGSVTSETTGTHVGGIVGNTGTGGCTVKNCTNNGTITGGKQVGGIAGTGGTNCLIENCKNNGEVSASEDYVGGITGGLITGTIESCVNNGIVISTGDYVSGITGGSSNGIVIINNCVNNKNITGKNYVSGIVGRLGVDGNQITNSYSIGEYSGNNYIGGILGNSYGNTYTITNSYYLTGTANKDVGDKTETALAKAKEFLTTTFVTTANSTKIIWGVDANKNNGYPYIIGNE